MVELQVIIQLVYFIRHQAPQLHGQISIILVMKFNILLIAMVMKILNWVLELSHQVMQRVKVNLLMSHMLVEVAQDIMEAIQE